MYHKCMTLLPQMYDPFTTNLPQNFDPFTSNLWPFYLRFMTLLPQIYDPFTTQYHTQSTQYPATFGATALQQVMMQRGTQGHCAEQACTNFGKRSSSTQASATFWKQFIMRSSSFFFLIPWSSYPQHHTYARAHTHTPVRRLGDKVRGFRAKNCGNSNRRGHTPLQVTDSLCVHTYVCLYVCVYVCVCMCVCVCVCL
jgi:hypothetical protein